MADASDKVTQRPPSVPPLRPDPNMIEHPEGNKRWRERYRAHARATLARANHREPDR
jgi:hypothetical protein